MLSPFAQTTSDNALTTVGERLRNCFAHQAQGGGSPVVLYASSGLQIEADLQGEVRAIARIGETLYIAANSKLWSWDGSAYTELADIEDGPTRMAASATKVGFIVDGTFYLYDTGDAPELDPDWDPLSTPDMGSMDTAVDVTQLANYFILVGSGNGRDDLVTWSTDGEEFAGLDFATAEVSADAIVGVESGRSELWLFGTQTTQIFYLSGNDAAPFVANRNASFDTGCKTQRSIVKEDNTIYWLDEKNIFWASTGGSPTRVSTEPIEKKLATSSITAAFAFTDRQHRFIALTNGEFTICYDLNTGLWSERSRGSDHDPMQVVATSTVGGVEYLATTAGKLATLSQTSFVDDGEPVILDAISGAVVQGNRPFTVSNFEVRFSSGQYELDRQPQVMLQSSNDGRRWGRIMTRFFGNLGEYYSQASWRRLGQFRRFHARITISDPVQRDIEGVVINGDSTTA